MYYGSGAVQVMVSLNFLELSNMLAALALSIPSIDCGPAATEIGVWIEEKVKNEQ